MTTKTMKKPRKVYAVGINDDDLRVDTDNAYVAAAKKNHAKVLKKLGELGQELEYRELKLREREHDLAEYTAKVEAYLATVKSGEKINVRRLGDIIDGVDDIDNADMFKEEINTVEVKIAAARRLRKYYSARIDGELPEGLPGFAVAYIDSRVALDNLVVFGLEDNPFALTRVQIETNHKEALMDVYSFILRLGISVKLPDDELYFHLY